MIATIQPAPLSGEISAIASKSDAHRLLILTALSAGESRIFMEQRSEDIDATIGCLRALGAEIDVRTDGVSVRGIEQAAVQPLLDCGESGSTLRFLLPVAAAICERARFSGGGRLPERPIDELMRAMQAHNVQFSAERLPFETKGRLTGGLFELPGNISSQYLTGLLLALALVAPDSIVRLTTPLESASYVDLTLNALKRFGVNVLVRNREYRILGNQRFKSPGNLRVEGDWSNGSFFLAAGALGAPVTVKGLNLASPQGDRAILDALMAFGARVEATADAVRVSPAPLRGCTIDVGGTPDLLPVLAVLGACAKGETRLENAARLRLKESDRLASVSAMLRALGADAEELPDALIVRGGRLSGGEVNSFHDHRIAMAAALAAIRSEREVRILDADAVNKSYPAFYTDYHHLGGIVNVV
ncbi:MAG: 3-phosphoshikimate 1-carboxyvinyltransferase [Eubacteriales bacterium]|nr:3-phosphoshikimate 1-carboxyvinyltransferase [Eubacteriales bacterium]